MDKIFDAVMITVISLVLTVGLPFIIYMASPIYQSKVCNDRSVSFDDHRYTFRSGCMVKHNDVWIPLENVILDKDK